MEILPPLISAVPPSIYLRGEVSVSDYRSQPRPALRRLSDRHHARSVQGSAALAETACRLSPIKQFATRRTATGRPATAYESEDVLRLKALAQPLRLLLSPALSRRCSHLRGHGGRNGAVRHIHHAIRGETHRYVFRTEVKGYYDAIDPDILMDQLRPYVSDPEWHSLLYQTLHRCVHRGGVFYVRYLDDLIILAPTRATLRRAIRVVNQQLTALRLEKHPDKTFIGKLSRGFDALGSRFDAELGVRGPSPGAVERFATRIVERYAQHEGGESLRHYVNRWLGSQTYGLSFERPDPLQPTQKQHRYDKQTTAPRSSTPRCPEKNHTRSHPAGLP